MKRMMALLMCIIILFCSQLNVLASVDRDHYTEALSSLEKKIDNIIKDIPSHSVKDEVASDKTEFNSLVEALVQEDNADAFFGEIVIDKTDNTITKDSNESQNLGDYGVNYSDSSISDSMVAAEPLLDAIGLESETDKESGEIIITDPVTEDETVIEGFVSTNTDAVDGKVFISSTQLAEDLAIETKADGDKIVITSPFQTKRIIVRTKNNSVIKNNYSAVRSISDGEGLYVFQYETENDAKNAYISLKGDSSVENVSIDKVYTVSNITERTGAKTIQSDRYKDYLKKNGKNTPIIVAVVDTGVDSDHPFLKSRLIKNGYNAYGQNTNWEDDHGHGTHVSGIIVDNTPSNVKILPVKVLGKDGSGSSLAVALGIKKAVELGADVINMSLGGECDHIDCPIEKEIISATKKNVSVVVAAGNDRVDTETSCPAALTRCITVASTENNGSTISSFSNFGDAVDIAAPGSNILSCQMGGGYVEMSGTSMATPFVAAAAAMVLTNEPKLTYSQVEKKLTSYATDMFVKGKDVASGYGILNFGIPLGDKRVTPDSIQVGRELLEIHYFGLDVSFIQTPVVYCDDSSVIPTDRSFTVTVGDPSVLEYKGCLIFPKKVGSTTITFTLENGNSSTTTVNIEDSGSWLNVAAKSYAGGKGTKASPYLISTPEQLAKFALDTTFNGKRYFYKLTNDIDLKGRTWIGANFHRRDGIFWGEDYEEVVFDGNNKKIKNMTVFEKRRSNTLSDSNSSEKENRLYLYNTGFICEINNAKIKNLGLENAYSSHPGTGLLCTRLCENTTIENCYTSGFSAGSGLFCHVTNYNVKVSNCYSSATVLQSGIAREIYSSLTGKVIFNNVFFCGESLDTQFYERGAGFSKKINNIQSYYTFIYNCFSASPSVSGIGFAENGEYSTLDKCYYLDLNPIGLKNNIGMKQTDLSAKPISFFKSKSTYTNSSLWNSKYKWDFNNIWAIDGKTNNGFPYLKNNKPLTLEKEKTNTWLDYAADSFAGGKGTKESPYLISTPEQLARIARLFRYGGGKDMHFRLTADINLSAHDWMPIGTGKSINSVYNENLSIQSFEDEKITKFRFYGNIDGNGKTISNMKISSTGDFIGFIAVNENNEIRNLNFKNISIKGNNGCGVVAGYNRLNAKIINCTVTGEVTEKTNEPLGGICGKNYRSAQIIGCSASIPLCNINNGVIKNCYNPAGLAYTSDAVIKNCYTESEIISPVIYHSYCEYGADGEKTYKVYDEVYGNIDKSRTVTEAELKNKSTFNGWFSDNSWTMNSGNGGKPYILSQSSYKTEILPTKEWADVATTSFAGGNGTKNNPYLIATPEQLAGTYKYIERHWDKPNYFRLIRNIDLSGRLWYSHYELGYTPYEIHFDGNGKVISGITTESGSGLFPCATHEGSVIENLTLRDFHGKTFCGIVGMNLGTIRNCRVECHNLTNTFTNETVTNSLAEEWASGITAHNSGLIEKCEVDVTILANHSASAVAAYSTGTIRNCSSKGFVLADTAHTIAPELGYDTVFNSYCTATILSPDSKYSSGSTCRYYNNSYSAADLTGEFIWEDSKYSADLKKKETFVGWDFNKVWAIDPNKNDGYPYIRQPQSRKITYVLNGGTNPKYVQTDYIPGKVCTPQTPTRNFYFFDGWYTDTQFKNKVTTIGSKDQGNITLYAKWKAGYNIIFNANGGTGDMPTQSVPSGETVALNKNKFTKNNYTFLGWATSKNGEVKYKNAQKLKDIAKKGTSITLYAVWKKNTYTVKFNSNGGSGKMPSINIAVGETFKLPVNKFTREGMYFAGWSLKKSGEILYKNGQSLKNITAAYKTVTLYAVWKKLTYTVKYNSNGGSGKMSTQKNVVYGGTALKKNKFKAPKGKVFAGWALSKNGKGVYMDRDLITNISAKNGSTITLYAKWVKVKDYKITYHGNGGKYNGNPWNSYTSGKTYRGLPEYTRKGYTMVGWCTDKELKTTPIRYIKPFHTGNLHLYAKWERNSYSVKFNAGDGSGTMQKQTGFKYGKSKALAKNTFKAPKGKVFAGWATKKNGKPVYTNGQKVKNLTSKNGKTVTLYAVWITPKTYKITYDTNGGKLSKSTVKTYKSGSGYSLPKPTRKGYTFVGWYTDSKLKTGKITVIKPWKTGAVKVYAKWKKN